MAKKKYFLTQAELASASLTPEESMQIIEQNIEQSNELKKAARKKQGAFFS